MKSDVLSSLCRLIRFVLRRWRVWLQVEHFRPKRVPNAAQHFFPLGKIAKVPRRRGGVKAHRVNCYRGKLSGRPSMVRANFFAAMGLANR